jgi:hypothetical protein
MFERNEENDIFDPEIAAELDARRSISTVNVFAKDIGISQKSLAKYMKALDVYATHGMLSLHSRCERPTKLDE